MASSRLCFATSWKGWKMERRENQGYKRAKLIHILVEPQHSAVYKQAIMLFIPFNQQFHFGKYLSMV